MNAKQREAQAILTYGDEQYAKGVDNGWTQALHALQDYAAAHPDAEVWQCLLALHEAKDKR